MGIAIVCANNSLSHTIRFPIPLVVQAHMSHQIPNPHSETDHSWSRLVTVSHGPRPFNSLFGRLFRSRPVTGWSRSVTAEIPSHTTMWKSIIWKIFVNVFFLSGHTPFAMLFISTNRYRVSNCTSQFNQHGRHVAFFKIKLVGRGLLAIRHDRILEAKPDQRLKCFTTMWPHLNLIQCHLRALQDAPLPSFSPAWNIQDTDVMAISFVTLIELYWINNSPNFEPVPNFEGSLVVHQIASALPNSAV